MWLPPVFARKRNAIAGHASLLAFSAIFALPFAWLVITSLKPAAQIFEFPPSWIPETFCWSNYVRVWSVIPFWNYTWNTLFVSVSATLATLVSSSLVAYGFAIIRWRWANRLLILMLATVMLPPQVTLIPIFILFKKLEWVGTFRPLIIPCLFGNAFFVFLFRQFFKTLPRDLIDAAKIDGCTHFDIYWRIVLALSKPVLSVVAFFSFSYSWNDFLGPLIYLNDNTQYTLALGLQQFLSQYSAQWDLLMAASTLMILPVILIFFLLQRTFVEGITLTGVKG
jgi:multiple sugar transport system permease protein